MKKLILRRAKTGDIKAIIALGQDPVFEAGGGMPFYYRREVLAEWIRSPRQNILSVAQYDGKKVGFLFCKLMSSRWALLDTFYLAPAFRGQGLGHAMFQAFVKGLKKRGVIYLSTLVAQGHADFKKMARHFGLEESGKYSWHGMLLIDPDSWNK